MQWTASGAGSATAHAIRPAWMPFLHTKLVAVDEACDHYLRSLLESRIFLLAVQVLSRYGLVLCPM